MISFSYDYLQNILNSNQSDYVEYSFLINSETSYKKVNNMINKKIRKVQNYSVEESRLDCKPKKQEQIFEKYRNNTNFNSLHIFYKFYKNIDCKFRFVNVKLQDGIFDILK